MVPRLTVVWTVERSGGAPERPSVKAPMVAGAGRVWGVAPLVPGSACRLASYANLMFEEEY